MVDDTTPPETASPPSASLGEPTSLAELTASMGLTPTPATWSFSQRPEDDVPPEEQVSRGLVFAALALPIAVVVAFALWRTGLVVASGTAWVSSRLAGTLYAKGSGTPPRKGGYAVLGVVVIALCAGFFTCVGVDLSRAYDLYAPPNAAVDKASFVRHAMVNPSILGDYWPLMARFVVFGVAGSWRTISDVIQARNSAASDAPAVAEPSAPE